MASVLETYPIADVAEAQYAGCGHALTAVRDGEIVAIRYIRDLDPQFDVEGLNAWVDEELPAIAEARRELAQIGDLGIGMCSSWEFTGLVDHASPVAKLAPTLSPVHDGGLLAAA